MPEWFQLDFVDFSSPSQYDTKTNSENMEWSFSIGYFERYINSKSDYLELLLSVNVKERTLKVWRSIHMFNIQCTFLTKVNAC